MQVISPVTFSKNCADAVKVAPGSTMSLSLSPSASNSVKNPNTLRVRFVVPCAKLPEPSLK